MKYRVTCKVKYEEHERISEIGCVDQSGTQRRFKEDEAINLIETREAEFYVDRPEGHTVRVIIAVSPQGHKFLKTEADGEKPNNLLSLAPVQGARSSAASAAGGGPGPFSCGLLMDSEGSFERFRIVRSAR